MYSKWLDDEKPTASDPDAVRSRIVATQLNTFAREDVTQATPPTKASRMILSMAASTANKSGQHDQLIARHDVRVAFFHAAGSGKVVLVPVKGLEKPGVGPGERSKLGTAHVKRASAGEMKSQTRCCKQGVGM